MRLPEDNLTDLQKTVDGLETRLLVYQEIIALMLAAQLGRDPDSQAILRDISDALSTKFGEHEAEAKTGQLIAEPLRAELDHLIGKVRKLLAAKSWRP